VTTTGGQTLTARVTAVFPFVDQGPRTAVVEAIVDNQHHRLLPGQYVTMEIATGERADAITVPRSAVARLGEAAKVWVVIDGRAEPRSVTTGLESAERVEIVRGLSVGERVVARGHEGLFAGARVVDTATGGKTPETPAKPNEKQPMPMEGGHAGH